MTSAEPAAAEAPVVRRSGIALTVLSGALALDLGGLALLNAALPAIGDDFGLEGPVLQWVMTAYAVAFAGCLLLSGRLADVYGRRRLFLSGVALFVVAALVGAVAPSFLVLVVARALQGLGAALSGPAALALMMEVFPAGPARNRAFSVYSAVGAAGFSGGIFLGGVLTSIFGWRSVLVFSLGFGLVVWIMARGNLPAGSTTPRSLDVPGAMLVTLGLVLAIYGVSRGGQAGWSETGTLIVLVLALLLLGCFVCWESRAAEPLLSFSLFRGAPVRAATVAAFLQYAVALAMLFFVALYLQGPLGYSASQSGVAVVPSSVAVFLTATFATGRLLGIVGTRALLIIGLLCIGGASLSWVWAPVEGNYWLHVLPGLVLSGVGQGLAFPAMTAAGLTGVPTRQHAVAGALTSTMQQIGASVGVALLVALAGTGSGDAAAALVGFHHAYLAGAIGCLAGALAIAVGRAWPTTEPLS